VRILKGLRTNFSKVRILRDLVAELAVSFEVEQGGGIGVSTQRAQSTRRGGRCDWGWLSTITIEHGSMGVTECQYISLFTDI